MKATKFTAEHVDSRIEAFIDWFTDEKLANLSDDDFNQIVTSLIKAKKAADVTATGTKSFPANTCSTGAPKKSICSSRAASRPWSAT